MELYTDAYIQNCKPFLKKLQRELSTEYAYASILAMDAKSKSYRIQRSGINISDDEMFSSRGFVVKVYDGRGYAEYAFNELPEDGTEPILAAVRERLIPLPSMPDGVTESAYAQLDDSPLQINKSTTCMIHPGQVGDGEIIERISAIRQKALAIDPRIMDCIVGVQYQLCTKLFLSGSRELEQNTLWTTGMVMMVALRGEEMKDYYQGYSNLGGLEVMDRMEEDLQTVAGTVLALLLSEPITPGTYECVCTPEVTGMIVHEAFGHGVEMDMFVKDRALAQRYIGEYVASPLVTMRDGAIAAEEAATFFFDDEGTPASDTVIIDRGILRRGICDAQSAMHLGVAPTGNGRRQSFERKAYTRMTNTFFEGGQDSVEDMIASVQDGFLLENPSSGMEDPKNWGIQCMVNLAREIKDGKLTGRIFSPIVLTGYVPDLLKSITMMSKNVELAGGGYCGKGYKEWVKVSDGGPYIKATIRLG